MKTVSGNFTLQIPGADLPIGTNKRLTKTLKRKIWGMRCPLRALKVSDIFLRIWKSTCMCRAVHMTGKDMRRP